MITKQEIADIIKKYFSDEKWQYDFIESKNHFTTGVNFDNPLAPFRICIVLHDDFVTGYMSASFHINKSMILQGSEYFCRANYGLILGNFELDCDDGEIRFKVNVPNCLFSSEIQKAMKLLIALPINMFEIYGASLLRVISQEILPKKAIEEAEKTIRESNTSSKN